MIYNLLQSLDSFYDGEVELLLENLPPYPWYFGGQWKGNYFMDAEEIKEFCDDTGYKICLDISHAGLYCNSREKDLSTYITSVRPYTRHSHIADAYGLDGEGVQIGEGDINWKRIMPLLDFETSWVGEIWRGHLRGGAGFITALNRISSVLG